MRHVILGALMIAGALIATSTAAGVLERWAAYQTHYETIGGSVILVHR